MGTDSGPDELPQRGTVAEAKVHVDMGMSPIKVISALTRVGANILGKQRDLGNRTGQYAASVSMATRSSTSRASHCGDGVKGG